MRLTSLRCLLCLLLACAVDAPVPRVLPAELAIAPGTDSAIDRATQDAEAEHPGQSAFRLVVEGPEAFAIRAHSALRAARSLDVQTYIWHADLTGMALAHVLLEAADRGVRVRLLLDDMDARAKSAGLAAVAAHPNVKVRLFNPFASRRGLFAKLREGLGSFTRLNGRMHNKTWIADNRVALAGGRNLGDEYFHASSEVNFVDLDFVMLGPVVRDVSASFDKYWNAQTAVPVELLDAEHVSAAGLKDLRSRLAAHAAMASRSRYADDLRASDALKRLLSGDWPLAWSGNWRFVSDDPLKVTLEARDPARAQVAALVLPVIGGAQRGAALISPYFVPGAATPKLAALARRGRSVRVLTNSLASNDVTAVHGGYARYREPLLAAGVQLWELKRLGGASPSLFGSSGASLHTKAFTVDDRIVFVGSFNLDARSTWLNCEQGLLVEDARLARELSAIFAEHTTHDAAWRVTLHDEALRWSAGDESFSAEPHASWARRTLAWLTGLLPLEAQL